MYGQPQNRKCTLLKIVCNILQSLYHKELIQKNFQRFENKITSYKTLRRTFWFQYNNILL